MCPRFNCKDNITNMHFTTVRVIKLQQSFTEHRCGVLHRIKPRVL